MNFFGKLFFILFFIQNGILFAIDEKQLLEINELIDAWDLETAESHLQQIDEDKKETSYLGGKIKFFRGEYKETIYLLDRAKIGHNDPFYELAKTTAEKTEGFRTDESEYFKIRYSPGRDEVLIPYLTDTLKKIRASAGVDLGYVPQEKVLIEIYPDLESFTSVTPLSKDAIANTGTVAICQFNRILITSPRLYLQGYSWLDTVSHEYIHYVLTKLSGNSVPLWLQEGLAKYFEVRWRKDTGGELTPWNKSILKSALATGDIVTFEEMGNSFANLRSARRAALAFAEVESMIEYIVKKYGMETLRKIINEYKNSIDDRDVITRILNISMDGFLNEWKKFTREIILDAPPEAEVIHPQIKEFSGTKLSDAEYVKDKNARDAMALAEILHERGRLDAAIVEYKKAVKFAPDSPYITNKLCSLLIKKSRINEARQLLENMATLYPDYPQTFINLSKIYITFNDDAELEDSLLKANAINPFDPFIHNELYLLYKRVERVNEAERENRIIKILEKEKND